MTADDAAAAQGAGRRHRTAAAAGAAAPSVVVLGHGLDLVGEVSDLAVEAGLGPVRVVTAATLEAACARLAEAAAVAAFVDLGLPESGGLTGLVRLQAAAPAVPIVPVLGRLEPEGPRGNAWRHDRGALVECLRNAARQQAGARHLFALATHDPLTGLANRYLLEERLGRALARARARRSGAVGAVLFVDLDGFKAVNDRHGHAAGDRVLVEVAARLRDAVRATDTVARFGGDEFVLVLEGIGGPDRLPAVVAGVADRLTAPLRLGADTDDVTLVVRGSIGAALFPEDADDAAALLRRADERMYAAKVGAREAAAGGGPTPAAGG